MDIDTSTFEINRKGTKRYNLKYKIILVGNSGVGKSCICQKQAKNSFTNDYISTNGFETFNSDVKFKNISIKLELYDTSGNQEYNSIIETLYKEASLIMIVYSIDE